MPMAAMCWFCPITTPGRPGMLAPARCRPGASMRAKYQSAGVDSFRCGSLASSGLAVVVRLPASTQLFEPVPSTSLSGAAAIRRSSGPWGEVCSASSSCIQHFI